MGIYLGQLPPAEVARFKAELAETVVANFCYPRFFDHRSDALQARPVDRTKRQEVWLYLSSVDFTAWSRVDLTSADFPHRIERLFIQFVQRNRSFFGAQGRRRMFDIRLSISSCANFVAQRLRNHLTGQQMTPPFGSPRPVLSWTSTPISGRVEPRWEQIMASTVELQRQLQEWRGELQTVSGMEDPGVPSSRVSQNLRPALVEAPTLINNVNGQGRRSTHPQPVPVHSLNPAVSFDHSIVAGQQPTMPSPPLVAHQSQPLAQPNQNHRSAVAPMSNPAASVAPVIPNVLKTNAGPIPASPVVPYRPTGNLPQSGEQNGAARQPGGAIRSRVATSPIPVVTATSPNAAVAPARSAVAQPVHSSSLPESVVPAPTGPPSARKVPTSATSFSASSLAANNASQREVFAIGEDDDVAIFGQMRHQLVLWLRIEAVSLGLEVNGQGPTQLLEMLRQQTCYDETRLQVVSTLLNLVDQVMKTGAVSVLDYKQALMLHLMHTKRH